MNYSEIAKKLGQRGGLKRAEALSKERRKEIAQQGAKARMESIELAKMLRSNFYYVNMLRALNPPPLVVSNSSIPGKLPGIYEKVRT